MVWRTGSGWRRASIVLVVALLTLHLPAAGSDSSEGRISDEERQELLELLEETEVAFLALIAGASDAQWDWKPAPERWSVGECAEHIVLSNEALFASAKAALAADPDPEWKDKTKGKADLLRNVMPNRRPGGAGGATAPQEIRPRGDVSRRELVERFQALYDELGAMVETTEDALKAHTEEHPFPVFSTLSAFDWIIYVPLHTTRHSRQMIEVMETEGYPSD